MDTNQNPLITTMKTIIYALVSKWYIIVVVASFSVLYSTYTAFDRLGLIQKAETIFVDGVEQIKGAAQNCMPHITDLGKFWHCLGSPHRYRPTDLETSSTQE